jgi:hypothetical protein
MISNNPISSVTANMIYAIEMFRNTATVTATNHCSTGTQQKHTLHLHILNVVFSAYDVTNSYVSSSVSVYGAPIAPYRFRGFPQYLIQKA